MDLCGDWLLGNLCLFLGVILGRNPNVMEGSAGKEFQNPSSNPCRVCGHEPHVPVCPHPAEPTFPYLYD